MGLRYFIVDQTVLYNNYDLIITGISLSQRKNPENHTSHLRLEEFNLAQRVKFSSWPIGCFAVLVVVGMHT